MKPLLRFPALWQGAIVALSLSAADVGRANPPTPQPATSDEGTTFWLRGDAAMKANHLTEAVDEWTKAWKHRPDNHRLACKIGRAQLRLGKDLDAATWLSRCRRLAPKPTTYQDTELAREHQLDLETALQKVSALTIDSDETETRVVINDKVIGITPVLEDVYLEPGKQQIHAYNGLRSMSMTLSTVGGKEYRVALSLPLPKLSIAGSPLLKIPAVIDDGIDWSQVPFAPPRYFRWWPVGVGGALAGTGLITGGILFTYSGIMDGTARDELRPIQADGKSCDAGPSDPRCASYKEYVEKSNTFSTAAIATFVATGAITTGVIIYIIYESHRLSVLEPLKREASRRVSVVPTLNGAVARYQW